MKAKALKKLLAGVTTLAMAAQFAFVLPANAATNSVAYDFEDGNAVFVDRSRFTVAIERNEGLSSNVVSFTGAHNAQNGYCFANYDFSELVDLATSLNIEFDYYNTQGGRAILTLGDASVRGETGGSGKVTYSNTGAAFNLGSNRDNSILNDKTTSLESYTNKWMHVALEVDESTNTYTYKITDKTGNILTQSESAVEFLNPNASSITQIDVFGYINDSKCAFIDNLKISAEIPEGNVYALTYNVEGNITTEQVIEGGLPQNIPSTDKTGYIFQGWKINGSGEIISTEELKTTPVMADVTYTAVYKEDPNYIEPIVSAVITGPSSMEIGPDSDTPAYNNYTLQLTGELGNIITSDNIDDKIQDFNIEWDIDGFRTVNDTESYCDGYGAFADHSTTATDVVFELRRNASMNFFGNLTATVTYNGETINASKYVVAISNTDKEATQILPEGGYPSDFDDYPDALIGYETVADTYEGDDLIVGGWNMAGSDSAKKAAITEENGNKFMRIAGNTLSKSHMLAYQMMTWPMSQAIFEQDIRFSNTACITATSGYAIWQDNRYAEAINLNFDGTKATLNNVEVKNGDVTASVEKNKWYKVVVSIDKATETAFVKIYDADGAFVGEALNVPWLTKGITPGFYAVGMPNKMTGTVDFDNYSAYYPTLDESTYTLSTTANTLSIPNGEKAELTASAKTVDGYEITGVATWSVVENDMKDGVVITPDENDSHKATVSVLPTASPGEATIQVNIGGYVKTVVLNLTSSAESVKFTSYSSSVSIPIEDSETTVVDYKASVVDGDGTDLGRDVELEIYDKNNVEPYVLPEGITFDKQTGRLTVTADAKACTFTVRATGENSDGEVISRSVTVTVHGLAFDFGAGTDDDVVEGYTSVTPETAYTEDAGYGITGVATAGGTASKDNADSDYIEGSNIVFKVNVPATSIYKVDITYSGTLTAEYVNSDLTGVILGTEKSLKKATFDIPMVDDVMDLTVSAAEGVQAQIASVVITKQDAKTPSEKTSLFTIGDSTLANHGSWAWYIVQYQSKYPELTNLVNFHNTGRGGSNLKKYYEGGEFYSRILTQIKPGDVVTLGNMGTNQGWTTEANVNYYLDAIEAFGGKIILNSYSPHMAAGGYEHCYDSSTHTFNGWRQDGYDQVIRAIAEERAESDPNYLGFVEIGKNADAAFNAYVADYAANGYESADAAAQAIIDCAGDYGSESPDHNHYGRGEIAAKLMVEGYGDVKGIVAQLVDILSAQQEPEEPTVSAAITSAANADGKTTVSASITVENGPVEMNAYAAIYDESGAMLGVKKLSGEGAAEVVFGNAGNAATAKVFVWKTGEGNEMIPFCNAAEADVTE